MGVRDFFSNRYSQTGRQVTLNKEELITAGKVKQQIFNALDSQTQQKTNNQTAMTEIGVPFGDMNNQMNAFSKYIYANERSKKEKLKVYREMAKYPEISFAVEEIVDEAINFNSEGECMKLIFKNKNLEESELYRKTVLAEWDYITNEVSEVDKNADRWFREFIIDGELAFEKIFDNDAPEDGIVRIKRLLNPSYKPIFEDVDAERILFYAYSKANSGQVLNLPKEAVAYANSGLFEYGENEEEVEVISLLENAKITYRRLKLMEDSLVVYRLVRAPERRIFHIDVGNLPKARAEQYVRDVMTRHRQKKYFDPSTGDISEGLDPIALTEDYYFPIFQQGKGSKVETLPGGQHLDEIQDVEFFLKKLYKSLRIPLSRFGEDKKFQIGESGDITREEDKFNRMVKRFTKRFSYLFKDIFITHLKLKGIWEEMGLSEKDFEIEMLSNNLFTRFHEAKLLALKFDNFNNFKDLMDTDEAIFPTEWVLKNILELTEEQYVEIQKLLNIQKQVKLASQSEEEGAGDE